MAVVRRDGPAVPSGVDGNPRHVQHLPQQEASTVDRFSRQAQSVRRERDVVHEPFVQARPTSRI
jgi:hypothetical protein